jgi:hypothetical protein
MSWMNKPVTSDKQFAACPAGSHPANLIAIIDLGTQDQHFGDEVSTPHQVFLVWELCNELIEGTKNRHVIGEVYTFSANSKAKLRIMLEAWRGRKYAEGEDLGLAKALGAKCLINIVEKTNKAGDKTYTNVSTVSALPKGLAASPPQRTPVAIGLEDDTTLPDWLPRIFGEEVQEVIKRCHENRPKGQPSAYTAAGSPAPRHTSANAADAYPATAKTLAPDDSPF